MQHQGTYEGLPQDGMAWDLAYVQQVYVQRCGASLLERINLFALLVADVRAQLIKKSSAGPKDGSKYQDKDTIDEMIHNLNGRPMPGGGTDGKGIRNTYRLSMDGGDNAPYVYAERAAIEILLDDMMRDLKLIIAKNNLSSQAIMALVSMQASNEVQRR